jgi:hypothetical protein
LVTMVEAPLLFHMNRATFQPAGVGVASAR